MGRTWNRQCRRSLPVLYLSGLDNYRIPRRNGHRVDPAGSHPPAQRGGSVLQWSGHRERFQERLSPGTSLNGSGQVVGLFEADGYTPSDIQTYETAAGLPSVPVVNVLNSWTPGRATTRSPRTSSWPSPWRPGITQVNVYEGSNDEIINAMATVEYRQRAARLTGSDPVAPGVSPGIPRSAGLDPVDGTGAVFFVRGG